MLVALIWLWLQTPGTHTFDIASLYALHLTPVAQGWIFLAFFLAFAIKMPIFPFHTWQPDTYVDAPAPGTMLLSGIMLKMGVYGILRWLLPLAPAGVEKWGPAAIALSVAGIVYASVIALAQKDFKRLIAYSSIAHVGLISAGIFTLTFQGMQGGVIQMISHGVVVVGLFFIAEIISVRAGTMEMDNLGGIRNHAPEFTTAFIIILLASVALPLTSGFIGELLLLNGIFQYNTIVAGISGLSVILGAIYMLRAYQKISLGESNNLTMQFTDLNTREKIVIIPLVIMIFWIGLYPETLLSIAGPSVEALQKTIQQSALTTMIK
jgi:NADH-quinone oxidoreductase subunit M